MRSMQNKEDLLEAVGYVVTETSKLAKKLFGQTFPIKSLTIFSHSQPEYELLTQILADMGKSYNFNNGPRVELYEPLIVENNRISHLRIRKPDPDRPQVGCNDFETDYNAFKSECLSKHPDNLHLIIRPEYEMIELLDPEFDVLAYVVSNS